MSDYFTDMCSRCDALCCEVYDIVDSETNTRIKSLGVRCPHLDTSHKCTIYAGRSSYPGFRESCDLYDCYGAGPIVTSFARKIPNTLKDKPAIISSLLETIRKKIEESRNKESQILVFVRYELDQIDPTRVESLLFAIKILRIKIEQFD